MVSAAHAGGTHGSGIVSSAADVIWMSVVRGMRGVGEGCVCVWLGAARVERGRVDEKIGFVLYQSCENRGSVGRVSVFGLRWCGWCRWGVGRGLGPGSGRVCYVCVRSESGFSV